ncbi:MAG: hypothetical protein K9J84_01470 [Bacteroidia bacterium]|nr:hypothetical protein [Bacteroidia bacterium]
MFFILLGIQPTRASYFSYTTPLLESQNYLARLQLSLANPLIDSEIAKHPGNVAGFYLKHYSIFYKVMVLQDKKFLPEFESIHLKTLKAIQELPDQNPEKLFLKSSIHLQSALLKGAFGEYLSAAWDFRSAYQEVNLNEKNFPSYLGHQKERGALMALIGTFPSQYQWVVDVVGLEGDFNKGLSILKEYINKGEKEPLVERQQAIVFYTLIQLNFGVDKKEAWHFYQPFITESKTSLMQTYVGAYVAGRCGENEVAIKLLKNKPQEDSYLKVTYLDFLMGEYLLQQLDFSAAIWVKKYIAFSPTKGQLKEAYQKLSWISWLQNDTSKFLTYKSMMEKYTKDAGSEGKLLDQDLAKNIFPSKELLKARLLFDGGYFKESFAQLSKVNPNILSSTFQKIEWFYRNGRLFQEENKWASAIDFYKKCLNQTPTINSYMVPNAALQLGIIYEKLNYLDLAKVYYSKVLTYSNYDYESSLRQKAKSNLIRVQK